MSVWQSIDVEQLDQMKSEMNMLVLDIREMQSYLLDHYPLALHVDSGNLRTVLKHTSKQVPIVIYCYHGVASQPMAELFADFGFEQVYSLEGGYEAWIQYLEHRYKVAECFGAGEGYDAGEGFDKEAVA